jgi:hypothetical protein
MTTITQDSNTISTTDKKTITLRRGRHKRQKFYGSGLTADHSIAYTETMLEDPDVFEDTKDNDLAAFFSSLQPGDIVGVIGDLLVVPDDYKFSPTNEFVRLTEFVGGTIKKPVLAKTKTTITWKGNIELGIYYRAGFVEHLYRDAVATDGGESMEVDEEQIKESFDKWKASQQQQAVATSPPSSDNSAANTSSLPSQP